MKEALELRGGLLPADAQSAIILEPRDRALDRPSSTVSPQASAILSLRLPIRAMRRDQIGALRRQFIIESIAVVRFVADEPIGCETGQHEVKEMLNKLAFMRRSGTGVDRNWKPS